MPKAAWTVAPSLQQLLAQLNTLAPGRSKVADGSIGDSAHAARDSDHNPDDGGVVRARDFTDDPAGGMDALWLREALRASRDARIKYVISEGQIFYSYGPNPWTWRTYNGPNGHFHHVHVSVVDGSLGLNGAPWILTATNPRPIPTFPNPDSPQEDDEMALTPEQAQQLDAVYKTLSKLDQWITTDAVDEGTGQPKGIARRIEVLHEWTTKPVTGIAARVEKIRAKLGA